MTWHYRNTVLILCTLALFVTMVSRLAISPIVPFITAEFSVSNTAIGVALTGMWLAYALTQFPSGIVADRHGERLVILIAIGGTGIGSVLIAVAPTFGIFAFCVLLLGGAAGLHYSPATTLLSRTFDNVGTAVGVHNSGAPLAGLLTPIAVTWIGVRYGWRPALVLAAIVSVPVFVVFATRVRPTDPQRPDQPVRDRFRLAFVTELLFRPSVTFTLLIAVITTFVWQGIASFLPTFLVEYSRLSATISGAVFSAYFITQGVAQVGVGAVSDRYGSDVTIVGCLGLGILGLGLFVLRTDLVSIAMATLLVGVSLSVNAAVIPRFFEEFSEDERGAGFGLVRTTYMVLASLGSVAVGFLADTFGWSISFGFMMGLFAVVIAGLVCNRILGVGY